MARQVNLIGSDGTNLGQMPTYRALELAQSESLDLVEVAPTAFPPVCKIADYGKMKFDAAKKDKEAKANSKQNEIREVKLRPKISDHDFETKSNMASRLLSEGAKVKVTIMFRGRELSYTYQGKELLDRMAETLKDKAKVEFTPKLDGKNMIMILSPV